MKQKGLTSVYIVVAVLILLAVGASAYFLGKNSQSPEVIKPVSVPKSNQTVVPDQAKVSEKPAVVNATPTPDPTADWKVYTNSKYGYSVKYPLNLKVNESETSYDQYTEFTLGRDASGNAYLPNYTITVAKESFQAKDAASVNFLSADWVNTFYTMNVGETKTYQAISFKKEANIQLVGQSAIVIDVTATGDNQKRVFLKHNGYVYMISDFTNSADFQNFLFSFKLLS